MLESSVSHCCQRGREIASICFNCKVSETWCALYLHQLIWQQLVWVFHWCWFRGRKWPFLATQGKMFVLRRAIESLSPSPSCSLASALKVTVCTHRHWLSLHFSLSFSLFLFSPLPSPISLWPSVSHFKNAFEIKRKKDWGTVKRRWKKRNRIRQKKKNRDRTVKIFTIIPSDFLSGNINPFNIKLVTVSYFVCER